MLAQIVVCSVDLPFGEFSGVANATVNNGFKCIVSRDRYVVQIFLIVLPLLYCSKEELSFFMHLLN